MGRPKKNLGFTSASVAVYKKPAVLDNFSEIITDHDAQWDLVLKRLTRQAKIYGFSHFQPPLMEDAGLYRHLYKDSPSREKTLAIFDQPGRQAALLPEILPSLIRSYLQNKISENAPISKWFYQGPIINIQTETGKLAQGQEYGFEVMGQFNHLAEAQSVACVWDFLNSLGLKELVLEINHIGRQQSQNNYQDVLADFLSQKKYELCDECGEHLSGRLFNVLRCGNLDCQATISEAPPILDYLDEESSKHFTSLLEALDEMSIPYQLSPLYVGPEGFSRTNFVIRAKQKNGYTTLGEGGYHDFILQQLSGKNLFAFGFVGDLGGLKQLLEAEKVDVAREIKCEVFLVPLGDLAARKSLRLFRDLVTHKIAVHDHFGSLGVKNQLKLAETFKAPIALIMGQKEAMDEMVILRDVKSGMQEIISYDKIVEEVKKRLGK